MPSRCVDTPRGGTATGGAGRGPPLSSPPCSVHSDSEASPPKNSAVRQCESPGGVQPHHGQRLWEFRHLHASCVASCAITAMGGTRNSRPVFPLSVDFADGSQMASISQSTLTSGILTSGTLTSGTLKSGTCTSTTKTARRCCYILLDAPCFHVRQVCFEVWQLHIRHLSIGSQGQTTWGTTP